MRVRHEERRSQRVPRHLAVLPAVVAAIALVVGPAGAVQVGASLHVDVSVPSVLGASGWKIWVANTGTASVLEFNARTGSEVHDSSAQKDQLFDSDAIVVVKSQVWVANSASDTITILSAKTGDFIRILHGGKNHFGASPIAMAVDDQHVFVLGHGGNTVVMFSASTDKLLHVLDGAQYHFTDATALAASGDAVWVLSSRPEGSLTQLSGSDGHVLRLVGAVSGKLDHPTAMSASGNLLWVANTSGDRLSELEGSTGRLISTPRIATINENSTTSILVMDNRLWLASSSSSPWVACVRELSHTVVHLYLGRFGFPAVFGGAGHAWVVDRTQSRVTEFNPSTATVMRVLVN